MALRVLFVASLHHPEQLLTDISTANAEGTPPPLFPTSMGQHFWERAMQKQGYELSVFWRNLSTFGSNNIRSLSAEVHTQRITLSKITTGMMQRLPPSTNFDFRQRNTKLIEQAQQFQPDLIWLIGDNRVVYPQTLHKLRQELGCRIVYASGTSPIVFSHKMERQAARLYDLVLVNDFYHGMQWKELGAKHVECLPIAAIDPEFHHAEPISTDEMICDVGFVGTLVPDNLYSERVKALEALQGFDIGIWSVHEIPATLRPFAKGVALGKEMLDKLKRVKISLNIHGDFMRYGGNMRLFETAAIGTFQIVDNRPGVHQWFKDGEHLVTFDTLNDLREKVRYYLEHDAKREEIAIAARNHVLANHTYNLRLQRVEELLRDKLNMDV